MVKLALKRVCRVKNALCGGLGVVETPGVIGALRGGLRDSRLVAVPT